MHNTLKLQVKNCACRHFCKTVSCGYLSRSPSLCVAALLKILYDPWQDLCWLRKSEAFHTYFLFVIMLLFENGAEPCHSYVFFFLLLIDDCI